MRYFGSNIMLMVNNHVVSYTDNGPEDAPIIIFIHGFPLNKTMWDSQVNALKENYRVISYDIRGHGDSEAGNEEFSIELFVSDLLHLMDALKIDKASLCGLSMGGYIALNAIENYPERFEAVVLSDTQCIADSPETKEKRIKTIKDIQKDGIEKYAEDCVGIFFVPESLITKEREVDAVKKMIMKTSLQSLYKTLLALYAREATCNKLPEITIPVLFIVGEEDKITAPEASELMHEKIKNSTMHVIEQAGHLSNLEKPDEFNEQLKTFFALVYKKHKILHVGGSTSIFSEMRHRLNMLLTFRLI